MSAVDSGLGRQQLSLRDPLQPEKCSSEALSALSGTLTTLSGRRRCRWKFRRKNISGIGDGRNKAYLLTRAARGAVIRLRFHAFLVGFFVKPNGGATERLGNREAGWKICEVDGGTHEMKIKTEESGRGSWVQ